MKFHDDIHIQNLHQKRHHVSIAHLNTQSLMSNVTELEAMVSRNQFDIHYQKHGLKDNNQLVSLVTIPGYNFEYQNRTEKRGGGVGIYVK